VNDPGAPRRAPTRDQAVAGGRFAAREQKTPEKTPEQFRAEVDAIKRAGKISCSYGVIVLPLNVPPLVIPSASSCPSCGVKKYAPRPHQGGQFFCFGCGYVGGCDDPDRWRKFAG
jgi:hypothetical protein